MNTCVFAASHVNVDSSSLNCYDKHNGTKTASGGGPYNGKKVFKVDTGLAPGFRYCNNISQDCGLNSGDYENYHYCRISDRGNGTDYYGTKIYANACQNGCAHLEQTDTSCPDDSVGPDTRFKCVGRSRSCQDFPWIYVFDGSNATNLKNTNFSKYAQTYSKANISGTAYYGSVGSGTYGGNLSGIDVYSWNTSGCKFADRNASRNDDDWNCSAGTWTWSAEKEAGGTAAYGFYLAFSTDDLKYVCNTCNTGWAFTSSGGVGGKCNACNTAEHFVHPTGSTTVCSCAYGYTRQGDTCVHPDGSYFYCTGNPANTCVCPSGFENITPRSGTCGNVSGGPCKQNFRFDAVNSKCVCDEPYYTWDKGDPDDPEDDECNVNNDTIYKDNTGWFKLGEESCGEMPWWL